jgi:hypothetical protein
MEDFMNHKTIEKLYLIISIALVFAFPARAQKIEETPQIIATGGAFTLEKAVTAGGGSLLQNGSLNQNGTTGQAVAGVRSAGGNFTLYSGFWTPDNLSPTAANAVVGGRILTASGAGIRNVQVTITFPSGEIRTTTSTTFGYYNFTEIPVGGAYVVSVSAKKYTFAQASQIRQVQDDLRDVDFTAEETQPLTAEKVPS